MQDCEPSVCKKCGGTAKTAPLWITLGSHLAVSGDYCHNCGLKEASSWQMWGFITIAVGIVIAVFGIYLLAANIQHKETAKLVVGVLVGLVSCVLGVLFYGVGREVAAGVGPAEQLEDEGKQKTL
jgi:hypothetical protein